MAGKIPIVIANPKGLIAAAAPFGLAPPQNLADFKAIVRLTRALIGEKTASLEAMQAAHVHTGQAFLCLGHGEALRGYGGMLPMNARAMPHLWMGQFDALNPDLDLLAQPGERIAAWWSWGIATVDHDAARELIRGLLALHRFSDGLPIFARAATPAGRRLALEKMDYHPMRYPDDDLLWAPPRPVEAELDHAA